MQIIRRNFGLKLLSVVLATIGWAYFRFATNPTGPLEQQLTVPLATINLAPGYLARFAEKTATISVALARNQTPVRADQIRAVLDLTGKESGIYNIPVQLVAPDLSVQSLSPASVTLTVVPLIAHTSAVTLHYVGNAQASIVAGATSIEPRVVSLHGPSDALGGVTAVRVDVPLPGAAKDFDEMLRPIAVDAAGVEVPDIDVSPNLVRVRASFVASEAKP